MNTDISVRFVMFLLYLHLTGKLMYLQIEPPSTSSSREGFPHMMTPLKINNPASNIPSGIVFYIGLDIGLLKRPCGSVL